MWVWTVFRETYFKNWVLCEANWNYAGLVAAWNAEDGHRLGLTATSAAELADAIGRARADRGGPALIECQIAHDDASPGASPGDQRWRAPLGLAQAKARG